MSDFVSSIDLVPYYPNFGNRISTSVPSSKPSYTSAQGQSPHIIVTPQNGGNRYTPAPSSFSSTRFQGYVHANHTPAVSNLAPGKTCNYDADCQDGLWCNPDPTSTNNGSVCSAAGLGNIGQSCTNAGGCLVGLGCYSDQGNTCQSQDIIGSQPVASAPSSAGGKCNFASDCTGGLDCINYKCTSDPFSVSRYGYNNLARNVNRP